MGYTQVGSFLLGGQGRSTEKGSGKMLKSQIHPGWLLKTGAEGHSKQRHGVEAAQLAFPKTVSVSVPELTSVGWAKEEQMSEEADDIIRNEIPKVPLVMGSP